MDVVENGKVKIDEDHSPEPAKPNFSQDRLHKIVLPREKVKMMLVKEN